MPVRCGIDLGTTYSSISWFDPYSNRVDAINLDSADRTTAPATAAEGSDASTPPEPMQAANEIRSGE
jgi:molecular chaperone DnaK (HSP70)